MILFNTEDYLFDDDDEELLSIDWQDFKSELLEKNKSMPCVLQGHEGLWNGTFAAGFCGSLQEAISKAINNMDSFKFETDENDELWITACHHDGHNRYHVRKLTKQGEDIWNSYEDSDSDYCSFSLQQIHELLMKDPFSEKVSL